MNKVFLVTAFCFFSLQMVAQSNASQSATERGRNIYEGNCLACHQADGSGVPNLTPPLIKTSFVTGDKAKLINIVLKGLRDVEVNGESYDNPMPAFEFLSDKEIADVLTYVRSNFGNESNPIKAEEVTSVRKSQ